MTDTAQRVINVGEASLRGRELQYVADCLARGWLTQGRYVEQLESQFAGFVGTDYAIAVSSGTAALHLALLAAGIKKGDEVIVPSLTFVATANAVAYTGATPVFVDVEPACWGLDPEQVKKAVTPRTKAIVPVHLYGAPVHRDIFQIARDLKLRVIEDAAEALGAEISGKKCGSLGDAGCFSFYGNKTITTGEGGMITTNNPAIAERARRLRGQGQIPGKRYQHDRIGFNYRMTDMQAAVGCAQMERLGQLLQARQIVADVYRTRLADLMYFQRVFTDCQHGNWMAAAGLKRFANRDRLMGMLAARGIETRPVFPPVHQFPMYASKRELPNTEYLARLGIVLPTHAEMTTLDANYVCEVVEEVLSE